MKPAAVGVALMLLFAMGGCGGTEVSRRPATGPDAGGTAAPDDAESTFNPSDYGIESWEEEPADAGSPAPAAGGGESATVEPDTLPGFRVQATITGDIDKATTLRDSLSIDVPGAQVYIVHHPPYYKIRVGDFVDRFAAGEMLELLRRRGFPDAWIVPDRVPRNRPPKPELLPEEPSAPADSLR